MEGLKKGEYIQVLDREDGMYWDAVIKEINLTQDLVTVWIPLCKLKMTYHACDIRKQVEERPIQRDSTFKRADLRLLVRKRKVVYKNGNSLITDEVKINDPFEAYFELKSGDLVAYERIAEVKDSSDDDDDEEDYKDTTKKPKRTERNITTSKKPDLPSKQKDKDPAIRETVQKNNSTVLQLKTSKLPMRSIPGKTDSLKTEQVLKSAALRKKHMDIRERYQRVQKRLAEKPNKMIDASMNTDFESFQTYNESPNIADSASAVCLVPEPSTVDNSRVVSVVPEHSTLDNPRVVSVVPELSTLDNSRVVSVVPELSTVDNSRVICEVPEQTSYVSEMELNGQTEADIPDPSIAQQMINQTDFQGPLYNPTVFTQPLSAEHSNENTPMVNLDFGTSSTSIYYPSTSCNTYPVSSTMQSSPSKGLAGFNPGLTFSSTLRDSSVSYLPYSVQDSLQMQSLQNNNFGDVNGSSQLSRLSDLIEKSFYEAKEQTVLLRRILEGQETMVSHLAKIVQEIADVPQSACIGALSSVASQPLHATPEISRPCVQNGIASTYLSGNGEMSADQNL